jgi:hypothetical protein
MSTYIWIWRLVLFVSVAVSLCSEFPAYPAFVPLDHRQVDLGSYNEARTGTADCAAADHSIGHLVGCSLAEFADIHHGRLERDRDVDGIAHHAVNNPSLCSLVLVAGRHFGNIVLHRSTSHSVALVLDTGLGVLVVGGGDCTGCEP